MKAKKKGIRSHCEMWPLSNKNVPRMEELSSKDIMFVLGVYSSIERLVKATHRDFAGPITALMGMAAIVGCNVKMQHILNRLGLVASYDSVDRIRKKIIERGRINGVNVLTYEFEHTLAIISVDNMDKSNRNGLLVSGLSSFGLHLTALQVVYSVTKGTIRRPIGRWDSDGSKHFQITNGKSFIDAHIPAKYDVDVVNYVKLVIGAVYVHQERLCIDDERNAISFTRLIMLVFEGFNHRTETVYRDVLDMNPAMPRSMDKILHQIYDMYGRKRKERGGITVVQGDQPTFRDVFRFWKQSLEEVTSDLATWLYPIPGGFHCEKQCIWPLLKWVLSGTGVEEFLKDGGLSAGQIENFRHYAHARRNRQFFFQFATAHIIKIHSYWVTHPLR